MLDLKAKLLAAGLVTADQVKKVEDEEAQKKQRAKDARDRKRTERTERTDRGDHGRKREDDVDAREAKKENALVESERWRKRLDELKVAGKSDQYDAVRGWVTRHRVDSKNISEQAERFHFMKMDGTLSHLTVEPDVVARLAAGDAAVVAFMGFNGPEHAVVPKDVAVDVAHVKPEWLRALVGVTDVAPPTPAPVSDAASDAPVSDAPASEPEEPK